MRTRPSLNGGVSGTRERLKRATAEQASHLGSSPNPPSLAHEQVADRAYEIYLRRGASHGDDLRDWLAAEQELLGPLWASATTPGPCSEADEADRT